MLRKKTMMFFDKDYPGARPSSYSSDSVRRCGSCAFFVKAKVEVHKKMEYLFYICTFGQKDSLDIDGHNVLLIKFDEISHISNFTRTKKLIEFRVAIDGLCDRFERKDGCKDSI